MAQIVKKNNELLKKYKRYKTNMIRACLLCGVSFLLWVLSIIFVRSFNPFLIVIVFTGLFGGGAVASYMMHKVAALKSGLKGENTTARIVSMLPDTYYGFQNLKITYQGKTSELDMVVVGPTGVFVIETKNMNGTIVGRYDNPKWVQEKIGRGGTPYNAQFYNPIKQVGTQVYRLANYLREKSCHVYINDMVYFSNPDTIVQLLGTPSKTPVFAANWNSAREICNYIIENKEKISDKQIKQIIKCFM